MRVEINAKKEQARRQEMKWGCFVKSGPFLNAGYIMYSIGIFYFTFYLFGWGCVRTQRTPLPTGLYGRRLAVL